MIKKHFVIIFYLFVDAPSLGVSWKSIVNVYNEQFVILYALQPKIQELFPHVCVHPLGLVLQSNRCIDGFGKKNEHGDTALIFHAVGMGNKLAAMSAVMQFRGIPIPALLKNLRKRMFTLSPYRKKRKKNR